MTLVSVITPAYNRESTITTTLDSLLAQSLGDWEAIVVDDGSTDRTAEIIEGYAGRDMRIRLHRQDNAGVSAARNAALALAVSPWVLFLDADDWIAPDALAVLTSALRAQPEAMLVHGGCVRLLPSGAEIVEDALPVPEEMFATFARTCAFSIHTCLVRTELVRAVGGFDESMTTSEDWDLWQRIIRTGQVPIQVPQIVAYYRIRLGSASRVPQRALPDGLKVIERGHGPDPRLHDWEGALHPGIGADRALSAKLYLVAYTAGLQLANGLDARAMLDLVPTGRPGDVDGEGLASILFEAIALGRGEALAAWTTFPIGIHQHLHEFVRAMAEKVDDNWLEFTTTAELEQLLVRHVAAGTSRIGHTQLRRIGVGREPEDIPLDPDLQHLLLVLDDGAQRLGTVVVPAINAVVPGRVAGDAVLTNEHAWALLARHIVDPVYPDLDVARTDGRLIIRRCNTVLADVDDEPQADLRKAVANAAGWTIFLQELWGLPDWPSQDFYTVTHHRASEPSRSVVSAGAGAVRVEIATELPVIVSDPAHGGAAPDIDVEVSLGGVPFIALRVPAVDGHLQPDRLRRAITLIGKYELFRVAMREAILTGEWPAEMPVRARLQELAARRSQAAATADNSTDAFPDDKRASALLGEWLPSGRRAVIVGRRTTDRVVGTAGRSAVFPFEKADLLARAAQTANQLVAARGGSGDLVGIGLYAPWLFEPSSAAICCDPDADRLARELDDVFAAGEDPWDYTSPYEQRKYDDTLALVPEQVDTALDVGCAEGIFTQRLAARARKLTAIDVSAVALARAKRRCADLPNVDFRQQNLFAGPLPSAADLIVCGEMLYFARDRGELACGVRNLVDALKPGGLLIVTHVNAVVDDPNAPGFDWDVPFGAAGIEGMILSDRRVALTRERITPMYRAQAYERIPRLRRITRAARASRVSERSNNVPELDPALARRFLVDGGSVRRVDRDAQTDRLPILMYHRIAPAAATCYRRWTTTPREFEQQLGWLDSHGYSSVSIDEWAAAAAEDLVLSGRRVILSFDDGYEDFCTYAVPLLLKYGFEAELFVASGRVGATNAWEAPGAPRYPLMDWSTLAALPPRTVRIGSHTVTHPLLITSSADDTIRELVESRTTLEERLGRQITSVAYPYGPADGAVRHLTGVAGYEYGYTTSDGCAYRDTDPLALPRIEIRGGEPIASFGRLVSGGGEQ